MPPTTGAVPPGRRELRPPPKLQGKVFGDAARIQDTFNAEICRTFLGSPVLHGSTHAVNKSDPLPLPLIVPKLVKAGTSPAIGSGPSYMREDAQLAAETGVPVMIGMANAEGSGTALARAAHVHSTPLTTKGDLLTVISGALGRVPVSGNDGWVLTEDSTVTAGIKWAAGGGPGAGNAVEVSINLGASGGLVFGPFAVAAAWVTATTKLVCAPFATTADGQTIETYAASGMQAVAASRVAGVGFDLWVYSPHGATGIFRFHVIGV